MRAVFCLLVLGLLPGGALAQQQVAPHDSQAITFYAHTTPVQEKAIAKYAKPLLDKAVKGGHPVEPRVANLPAMIIISLESVHVCDWAKGCPLLVFRDITKAPTLQDYAYQNMSITQRKDKTYLILHGDGPVTRDCLIPAAGKAKCVPAKGGK